jgi:hypothetical protein
MISYVETYDTTTEESANEGDYSEIGYCLPYGWKFALRDEKGQNDEILNDAKKGEFIQKGTLADLIRLVHNKGYCLEYGSIHTIDDDINYETGEHTQYSLHIKDDVNNRHYKALEYAIRNNLNVL